MDLPCVSAATCVAPPAQAFTYLALVEKAVSSAVAPLGRADAETVRRAASLALVESMNT